MTLIQALRSGKPLARKDSPKMRGSNGNGYIDPDHLFEFIKLTKEDILAEDWEIKEERIEITPSQLIRAIAKISKERACRQIITPKGFQPMDSAYGMELLTEYYQDFLKELGFKD